MRGGNETLPVLQPICCGPARERVVGTAARDSRNRGVEQPVYLNTEGRESLLFFSIPVRVRPASSLVSCAWVAFVLQRGREEQLTGGEAATRLE